MADGHRGIDVLMLLPGHVARRPLRSIRRLTHCEQRHTPGAWIAVPQSRHLRGMGTAGNCRNFAGVMLLPWACWRCSRRGGGRWRQGMFRSPGRTVCGHVDSRRGGLGCAGEMSSQGSEPMRSADRGGVARRCRFCGSRLRLFHGLGVAMRACATPLTCTARIARIPCMTPTFHIPMWGNL